MSRPRPTRIRPERKCLALMLLAMAPASALAIDITVVDQNGQALQHAVVTASTATPWHQEPQLDATVAQSMQQFLPRVTVVAAGSRVHFPNRDTTQHHVYSFSEARQFELELYKGESQSPINFDNAGIVALGCNIHDWMLGYVFVTNDPLFASSEADGTLSLAVDHEDIETLTVWHPASVNTEPQTIPLASFPATRDSLRIVIETGASDPLDFALDPLQQLFKESAE